MTDSTTTLLVLTSVVALVAALVGLAIFLWYAAALSRVFARRGVEPWRAWVPVLNEAELLRLGGRPAWAVVFFFIPVVCVYAVVLHALAAHRIGRTFGRGGGATTLAVLLPPVWATVLASTRDPGDGREEREGREVRPARPVVAAGVPEAAAAESGAAVALTPAPSAAGAAASDAAAVPVAGAVPLAPPGPLAAPVVEAEPAVAPAPAAVPAAAPAAAVPAATVPAATAVPDAVPAPAAPADAAVNEPAWPSEPPAAPAPDSVPAPAAASGSPTLIRTPFMEATSAPATQAEPEHLPSGPATPAPALTSTSTPGPAPASPAEAQNLPPASSATPPTSAPADLALPADTVAPTPPPASAEPDPDLDSLDAAAAETIVVDRRVPSAPDLPTPAPSWVLVTDDGARHPLDAPVVVLGRRPAGDEPGVQYLAVPDTSRTLSKQHACLTRDGDDWTITDLDSTNGVFVERDGVEQRLAAGETAVVTGRIVLGTVGAALEREESR